MARHEIVLGAFELSIMEKNMVTHDYQKGLNDMWDLFEKIAYIDPPSAIVDIFGYRSFGAIIRNNTPNMALNKMKAYEEAHNINVGDIVRNRDVNCIVLDFINDEDVYVIDENECVFSEKKSNLIKLNHFAGYDKMIEALRSKE